MLANKYKINHDSLENIASRVYRFPQTPQVVVRSSERAVIVVGVLWVIGCKPDRCLASLAASGHAGATVHLPWWCGPLCSSASELGAGSPALWSGEHLAFELSFKERGRLKYFFNTTGSRNHNDYLKLLKQLIFTKLFCIKMF